MVDSTVASETLAFSTGIKSLKHCELRLRFYHISPPKPYKMYTDSSGGKLLAANPNKLGRVRHLNIRHHMVKCYIQIGDILLIYCCTEAMLADAQTKICDAAQRQNLGLRFYCDSIFPDGRFYKTACFEKDCVVRIADESDFSPAELIATPRVALAPSAEWTINQLDEDGPFPIHDLRWCSDTVEQIFSTL